MAISEDSQLSVKREVTSKLYDEAGGLVEEQADQISLARYSHLLTDKVARIIDQVLQGNPLPFPLQDFQKLTLHAIGSLQNVILVSPTGSGKMIVAYLAIKVLQIVFKIPDGVGVGTQPLNSIMLEKLKSPYLSTGVISMKEGMKSSFTEDAEEKVSISHPLEDFKNGSLECMIGHAESWMSKVGQSVLQILRANEKIIFSFLDEAHSPLTGHWDSFRPQMRLVPGHLRAMAVRGAPCLSMTATLTKSECLELKQILGLRANTVVLEANPIQSHHKYVKVQRPHSIYGAYGKEINGEIKPGLIQVLNVLYFDQFVEKIKNGVPVKSAICLFKNEDDLVDSNDDLSERLPECAENPSTCPWVMNHSSLGPVTARDIQNRTNKGEIKLFLTTAVMLMGIDLKDINIVIMVRPFSMIHYIVQACGRGGRKMSGGTKKKVIFYLLWNRSDIAENVPGLSPAVREFCLDEKCLKSFLMKYFGSTGEETNGGEWCCSNCDM